MTNIIEQIENVTIRREYFAPNIRIVANPEDMGAGVILLDLQKLEYQNDELAHTTSLGSVGETVAQFTQRTFVVGDKEISGLEVALLIKQYVDILHAGQAAEEETGS